MTKVTKKLLIILSLFSGNVIANYQYENLGNGFRAMTTLADPFSDQRRYLNFSKADFTFTCDSIDMQTADDMYYDGFSFNAQIALKVDNNNPINKAGKNSSYLNGSDLVTKSDYYSTQLTPDIIKQLKLGNKLVMAGKTSTGAWKRVNLNLKGFTKAYQKVCKSNLVDKS